MLKLLIFLIIFSNSAWSQTDYAMIINAPQNEKSNYPNFTHNTLKAYRTFGLSGITRDRVAIMNADGSNPFKDKRLRTLPGLVAGVPAAHQIPDASAKKVDLKKKFLEMAKKMKDGDHFTLFITGHGQRKDGKVYIRLWGEEKLSIEELRSYLKLLPAGVTKHITGHFCFSGALMALTSEPNTCAFSPVDEKTLMGAWMSVPDAKGTILPEDKYTDTFLDTLLKGTAFYDAQQNAERVDPRNSGSQNSLDWYLKKSPPKGKYACDEINDQSAHKLLRNTMGVMVNKKAPYQGYLDAFKKYRASVESLRTQFDKLSPQEQTKKRGEFTRMIEVMKQNAHLAPINNKAGYIREMAREQEFIENASAAQFKKYLQIKACVNYAIKK